MQLPWDDEPEGKLRASCDDDDSTLVDTEDSTSLEISLLSSLEMVASFPFELELASLLLLRLLIIGWLFDGTFEVAATSFALFPLLDSTDDVDISSETLGASVVSSILFPGLFLKNDGLWRFGLWRLPKKSIGGRRAEGRFEDAVGAIGGLGVVVVVDVVPRGLGEYGLSVDPNRPLIPPNRRGLGVGGLYRFGDKLVVDGTNGADWERERERKNKSIIWF